MDKHTTKITSQSTPPKKAPLILQIKGAKQNNFAGESRVILVKSLVSLISAAKLAGRARLCLDLCYPFALSVF